MITGNRSRKVTETIGIVCAALLLSSWVLAAGKPVVMVNGEGIGAEEIDITVNNLIRARYYHQSATDQQRRDLRLEAIEQLIVLQLRLAEAKDLAQMVKDADVEAIIHDLRGKGSDREYDELLRQQGLDRRELARRVRRNLMVQAYMTRLTSSVSVDDRECKAYYDNNPSMFQTGAQVRLYIITAQIPSDRNPVAVKNAQKLIRDVQDEYGKGASFQKLAQKYSQDEFASKGGDMGLRPVSILPEQIQDAIKGLPVGKASGVVETIYGFHLLMPGEIQPSHKLEYGEVAADIKKILRDSKVEKILKDDQDRLIRNANIVIFEPDMAARFAEKYRR